MIRHTPLMLVPMLFTHLSMAQVEHVVNVTDHRPLASALDQIETVVGSPINYEDIPYGHDDDLETVKDPRIRSVVNGRPARLPRKGTVNFRFTAVDSQANKLACLNDLLVAYRRGGLPGDFRVDESNGMFYVVANKVKASDGKQRDVVSPMLARITIPYARRTVIGTIGQIAAEVSKVQGVQVLVGQVPFLLGTESVSFGADRETARDALARLLNRDRPVSYRLLFDPLIDSYMLNLQVMHLPRSANGVGSRSQEPPSIDAVRKWLDPARP